MDNADANNSKNSARSISLGLKQNINQFSIPVLVKAFVVAMIGLEQTIIPLIGRDEFGIESNTLIVSFIASFGAIKAVLNLFIGIIAGMSFLGIGTALVYPTLLAAISDIVHPRWRATSLGVYRFWRDLGFVIIEYPDTRHCCNKTEIISMITEYPYNLAYTTPANLIFIRTPLDWVS